MSEIVISPISLISSNSSNQSNQSNPCNPWQKEKAWQKKGVFTKTNTRN
jgi:hypothetical protein